MKDEVRIAQIDLTCAKCKGKIGVGHPYIWAERKVLRPNKGLVVVMERVHPQCREE